MIQMTNRKEIGSKRTIATSSCMIGIPSGSFDMPFHRSYSCRQFDRYILRDDDVSKSKDCGKANLHVELVPDNST